MVEIDQRFTDAKERLDSAMRTGSYSLGFVADLAAMMTTRPYDPSTVMDEIATMEGVGHRRSSTKPPMPFKGRHLRGYWHKHHTQNCFMIQNLRNELHQDRTIHRVLAPYIGQMLTHEMLRKLTHAIVYENYMRRWHEGRLTGEWIVYSKRRGSNHYVTLASHSEDDAAIANRVSNYEKIDRETGWIDLSQDERRASIGLRSAA